MSRKYSIGFLIVILVFTALLFISYKISYNRAIEKYDDIEGETLTDHHYYLKNKEGYVTVYDTDGQVYEYTSLLCMDLPVSIQEELKYGIQVDSLGEVYGFLENYSS